jgi:hypothetical protein
VENVQELLAGSSSRDRLLDGSLGLSLLLEQLLSSKSLGVWVESEEDSLVSERVLLLGEGSYRSISDCQDAIGNRLTLVGLLTTFSDDGLDLVRVDESGNVRRGDLGLGEDKARLLLVDGVEGGHGGLGPDDKSTDVTTWGELEEVKGLDGASLDTWNVLESSNDSFILGVNDEGTPSLPVSPVPQLSLSSPDLSGVGNLGDVGVSGDGLE